MAKAFDGLICVNDNLSIAQVRRGGEIGISGTSAVCHSNVAIHERNSGTRLLETTHRDKEPFPPLFRFPLSAGRLRRAAHDAAVPSTCSEQCDCRRCQMLPSLAAVHLLSGRRSQGESRAICVNCVPRCVHRRKYERLRLAGARDAASTFDTHSGVYSRRDVAHAGANPEWRACVEWSGHFGLIWQV